MSDSTQPDYDVVIVGGGPGGSTTGALLAKYAPSLRVLILERETFPRDHVGESQLPPIGAILDEMGCWDEVEAAGFPIKIGVTYRWGESAELWDFELLPSERFRDEPRPAAFAGQRRETALQVDRARYDDILLRRAATLGCEVRQATRVVGVRHEHDRVTGLELEDGAVVTGAHYVDASGHVGVLRRALGVAVESPTRLKNIAAWDYWENAEWAVEIGVGGTRVQVMSVDYGWLWFIPLGPTRTSIGLVCPVSHYKASGKTMEQLYLEAIANDPRISRLTAAASRRGKTETTSDWSFLAERSVGANWFLVGESAGFADPILAAGMTVTQGCAREAAHTLLELFRDRHDPGWLRANFDTNQRRRIHQHIRFADFWYASNGQFTDLQDHCKEIAAEAGLEMNSEQAWAWLSRGGLSVDTVGQAGIGGLDLAGLKQIAQRFTAQPAKWMVSQTNVFELALADADPDPIPVYKGGRIEAVPSFSRDGRRLVLTGMYRLLHDLMARGPITAQALAQTLQRIFTEKFGAQRAGLALHHGLQALEVMLSEGWVLGRLDPSLPRLTLETPDEGAIIHRNRD